MKSIILETVKRLNDLLINSNLSYEPAMTAPLVYSTDMQRYTIEFMGIHLWDSDDDIDIINIDWNNPELAITSLMEDIINEILCIKETCEYTYNSLKGVQNENTHS